MSGCCEGKCDALAGLRERQGRVLKIVLAINLAMFAVEAVAGVLSSSSSLLADSLDMFGDAVVYASSLYVLNRGARWQARMAALKGMVMLGFAGLVLVDVSFKVTGVRAPSAEGMGAIGVVALAANLACLFLLTRHREDDINMRSVWICSRNDIVANVGVTVAAGGVALTRSRWPDVIIGSAIALVFLSSAVRVMRDAVAELRTSAAKLSVSRG